MHSNDSANFDAHRQSASLGSIMKMNTADSKPNIPHDTSTQYLTNTLD